MKRKNRSILRELDQVLTGQNERKNIEARASHVISSAFNLLESLEEEYSEEEIKELQSKMFSAIRNKDTRRFNNALNKIEKNRKQK